MTKRVFLILLSSVLIHRWRAVAEDGRCPALKSPPAAIAFLEEQTDSRRSPCITTAIRELGRARSTQAIPVLLRYLDFVDPATAPKPDGFTDKRPNYPAVGAIFLIGKPATEGLLSTIQASESPLIRRNAAKAYQAVYRDDLALGINTLRTSEMAASSTASRKRLRDVRGILAEDCSHRTAEEALMCKKADDK